MVDRPIIFSAPMARALLDGRKTMTRRVLNPQPRRFTPNIIDIGAPMQDEESGEWGQIETIWSSQTLESRGEPLREEWRPLRIKYRPGDRLWVRENWKPHSIYADLPPREMPRSEVFYAADNTYAPSNTKWIPSIHMPRWASRLTLIVESVKVERLQDVSEADALAEGVVFETADPPFYYVPGIYPHSLTAVGIEERCSRPHAVASFAKLWQHIHGPGEWEMNPFVAAITLRTIRANIDTLDGEGRPLVCEEVTP